MTFKFSNARLISIRIPDAKETQMNANANKNATEDSTVDINEITDHARWQELLDEHGNGQLDFLSNYNDLDHATYASDHVIDRGENKIPGTDEYQKSDTGYMRKGAADYVYTITGVPK